MKLSIIIPTCNRNELLGLCLDKLAPGAQTLPAAEYEVIVSDDGQGYPAEAFCRQHYPWVRYTRGPQRGPAANRNHGAGLAVFNWLVFLDDDCIPEENLLAAYATAIDHQPQPAVLEGRISAIGEKKAFNEESPVNETGGNLWSCNFCIEKAAFLQTGGFDEAFPFAAMEDIDFKTRVERHFTVQFCKDAQVFHPWKRIENPNRKFEQSFISCRIFLEKWPGQNRHFSTVAQLKKLVHHFFSQVLPKLFAYRFSGLGYVAAHYGFMLRMAVLQGKKGFFW